MKNIIITGAANGVGKAVANILKENNLILVDEDNNNLEQVAKELNSKFYVCNLANDSDIKTLLNAIKNDYCGISQKVNAVAKGQYSFQMLSEIYIQSAHPNGDVVVVFYSINEHGVKTLIKEELYNIGTEVKTYTSTFSSLTSGLETCNSNPSLTIFSIKIERCNSPLPDTIQDSLFGTLETLNETSF